MKKWIATGLALSAMTAGLSSQAADTIKVGLAGPLTGPVAEFGMGQKFGAEAAVKAYNAKGGKLKIELVMGDDACDPKQAVTVAHKLAEQDKVAAVVGHLCSSSTIPAFDVYNEAGVVALTPSATNPGVTAKGHKNVFRVTGRDDQQAVVAADYVVKNKFKRVVVLHDKDSYGKGLADEFKKRLNAQGVKEVMFDGINPGEKNYNAIVTKIRSLKSDLVYWGGYHPEAAVLVKEMRNQGIKAIFFGADGIYGNLPSLLNDDKLTKDVYVTFTPDFTKFPENQSIVSQLKKDGVAISAFTMPAYAVIQVLTQALEKNSDVAKLSETIHGNTFDTVVGKISFDERGDLTKSAYVVFRYEGKDMVEVKN